MTAKIICFASAKGGTGKTVTAASLAKLLGGINKKVLLIDVDIDTNGLTLFYLHDIIETRDSQRKKGSQAIGIFEVLSDRQPMPHELDSHVHVIPASNSMSKGITEEIFRKALSRTIDFFSDKYDYIFLDAQAGTDSYAEIAIEHSDEVVIVSEYDPVSIEGIERFKGLFFKTLRSKKTWTLFNKVLPEFADSVRDFFSVALYPNPIPWDKDVMLAFAHRELAIDTENFNEYTKAMIRTARSLMHQDAKEIDKWLSKKREALRRPILDELEEVGQAIKAVEDALTERQYMIAHQRGRPIRFAAIVISILSFLLSLLFSVFSFPLEVILSIAGLGIGGILSGYLILSQLPKKAEIDMEREIHHIRSKLKELEERRGKLRVIAERA